MIDQNTIDASSEFRQFWNNLFQAYPHYQLNYSWPSVRVVDLILEQLKGNEFNDDATKSVLLGASSYLASMVYQCWKNFSDDIEVTLVTKTDSKLSSLVTAKGGKLIPSGSDCRIDIYQWLETILKDPPNPMPTFTTSSLNVIPTAPLITTAFAGILSGLSPWVEGAWKHKKEQEFLEALGNAATLMSSTSALDYQRINPLEPHGADWHMYFPHMVLPPMGHNEPAVGTRGLAGFFTYCKSK